MAGTWDPHFSRNRALRKLLRLAGHEVVVCRVDLWGEREDAIIRKGKLAVLLRALLAYPRLTWQFLRTPSVDVVLIPYPGHFDVPLLAFLCRLRNIPVVFDPFISLFDTIVVDRGLARRRSAIGRLARWIDNKSCRASTLCLTDTPSHAEYFAAESGVSERRFRVLWVGAREDVFFPRVEIDPEANLVVFYGSFIPLQGLDTIVRAAALLQDRDVRFRIIGDGQERPAIERLIEELQVTNIELLGRMPLERLPEEIARATICLGIFGTSEKAARVVPHKLYEALAVGRPAISGDTPALRSAFSDDEVYRVPVGRPEKLASAVDYLVENPAARERLAAAGHARFKSEYSEEAMAALLGGYLDEAIESASASCS